MPERWQSHDDVPWARVEERIVEIEIVNETIIKEPTNAA